MVVLKADKRCHNIRWYRSRFLQTLVVIFPRKSTQVKIHTKMAIFWLVFSAKNPVKSDKVPRTAVASMRRTEALASVKFYQIMSIFIFFIRLIILEDFIRLISYNGPCVRLGCSFFLATALNGPCVRLGCSFFLATALLTLIEGKILNLMFLDINIPVVPIEIWLRVTHNQRQKTPKVASVLLFRYILKTKSWLECGSSLLNSWM